MNNALIRAYRPADIPELTALWTETFGDSEELIGEFFRLLPAMGTAVTAECGGAVAGGAYAVILGELRGLPQKAPVCGYIYAVAVNGKYRHRGLGAALVRAAGDAARRLGADIVCTLPAEDSLYRWYGDILGVRAALRTVTREVRSAPVLPCKPVSAGEYMRRREELLRGRVRMSPTEAALEFTRSLCGAYGGGLYDFGAGICAAYTEDGVCLIRELVCENEDDRADAAASVGALLGVSACRYRLPAEDGDAYIAAAPGAVPAGCVWNISFD